MNPETIEKLIDMNLEKIKNKLSDIFQAPYHNQGEIHDKLTRIIHKLERKKNTLKEEMIIQGEQDETSERYYELEKEYQVVNKLLKKARKNHVQEPAQECES